MEVREAAAEALKFFEICFPEADIKFEIRCGYFGEWVERFLTGEPERFMDHINTAKWRAR